MNNGIITYADSVKHIQQAVLLAVTAKKNSGLPVTIAIPPQCEQLVNAYKEYFDTICLLDKVDSVERGLIDTLTRSPYDNTLFLYSDTLILTDIADVFLLLDYHDIVMNDQLLDFKGSPITRQLYEQRKMIVKNNLVDVWSNAILYKKSDDVMELTKLTHRIITFWRTFKDQFLKDYSIDDKLGLKFNVALCLASKLSDTTIAKGFTISTMSKQEENTASLAWANLDWFKFLNAWIMDNSQVKVENYIQAGIWHYGKNWLTDDIYNRMLTVYA